jgi:aldehyde:ferredoxin oxidoreductase
MTDVDHAAGRSGMGAVLGSKRLKAIAVRGTNRVPLHDRTRFKRLVSEFDEILKTDRRSGEELLEYGTTALVDHHQAAGCMNVRNYNGGIYEHDDKIGGDALNAQYLVRPDACYRCPCKCDRYSRIDEGEFAGTEVGGPEYGTVAAFGSGCDNANLASIIKANELCNRYGMDTIETGNIISFAMELYDRGILTPSETDGLDLSWGNYHAILDLTERIAFRRGLGDVLANGIVPAAQEIGSGAERYAVHVKGMTPPGPDARALKVYNFRYAVSPRGCDHLRISAPGAYGLDHLPMMEAAQQLHRWELIVTLPDLMGTCKFPYSYYAETIDRTMYKMLKILPAIYSAATGIEVTGEDLLHVAERITNVERAYNARLGLTREHDAMPPRWTEDPLPSGPKAGAIYDILEPMKDAWYEIHGWDIETGRPRYNKLVDMGLADIARDLESHGIPLT